MRPKVRKNLSEVLSLWLGEEERVIGNGKWNFIPSGFSFERNRKAYNKMAINTSDTLIRMAVFTVHNLSMLVYIKTN